MTTKNKFGLSRHIPSDIARSIRPRCGFGCVICGLGFYDYEHFAPDFSEAKTHDPNGMTLLCSQCNQKRARGRLSADTVAEANKNPHCLQQGFSSEFFDFAPKPITVFFAGVSFYDCQHLVMINRQPIISVRPSKTRGQPVFLSGIFTDGTGRPILTIENNQWRATSNNWDVECVGPRITIRSARGAIALQLLLNPSASCLTIERLDMKYEGAHLIGNQHILQASINGKSWATFSACDIRSGLVGIAISTGWPQAANDPLYSL